MPGSFPPPTRRQTPRAYIANDTDLNMALFHNKLQRLLNGDDTLGVINLVGDSLTLGTGGTYYRNSIGARLAAMLRAAGFTVADHKFGVYSSGAATVAFDPRFALTGTWDAFYPLPGGTSFRCTSNAGKMTYSAGVSFDTANLIWFRDTSGNGGGGNMTITVDGGATNFSTPTSGGSVASQTISQSGAASLQSLVITVAAGVHTIEVTNGATGNIQVFGIEVYNVATPTILLRTMGFSGYTAANYVANNIPNRFYENTVLQAQLQVLCIGANDSINAGNLATYSTNVGTLKGAMTSLGTANVLGWTWPPCAATTQAYATQQTYIDAFKTAMGTSMILDQYQRYIDRGGQEAMSAGAYYKDAIHPDAFGNIDVAAAIYAAIMPMGV